MTAAIDVIVPVYGGLEEVQCCMRSLMATYDGDQWHPVVINDASPYPEISRWLTQFAESHPEIELLENPTNLGFVGTVNRGMRLHPERDVVLLNSDTEVPRGWLERLAACVRNNPDVASVTPFSNNATICSFPRYCEENPLTFPLEALDAAFQRANAHQFLALPTGVGFCMYITRAALNKVGYFDEETFGKGYGEENDFCRRAAAQGMSNLLCCDLFVHHSGGASFAGEKEERAQRAQELLDRRYPDYHRLVMEHIQRDQEGPFRLAAWIELLRLSGKPKILHLTHHLGGGTLKHVEELIDHLRDQAEFLLLKPDGDGGAILDLSGHAEDMRVSFRLPDQYQSLIQLLRSIGLSALHFHHTLGLETSLWGLPRDLQIPFDITLHDYYFLNANPTQTDEQGRYCAELSGQARPWPLPVSVEQWQENQKPLLYAARRVIAPSAYTANLYRAHFPNAKYTVAFHPEWEQWAPYPAVRGSILEPADKLRVLVFGAISIEKGADLLEAAAKEAKEQDLPVEFHLIGYAYRPLEVVIEHGSYDHQRVVEQIREHQPHLIWFTALWPETYSYTLSEALASGYPILAPNHGSFPERLQGRPLTWIESWDQPATSWMTVFETIREILLKDHNASHSWDGQIVPQDGDHFYLHNYILDQSVEPVIDLPDHATLASWLARPQPAKTSYRERMLLRLIHMRQARMGRWISRMTPVRLQRFIKRKLSSRPIHEVLRD